MKNSILRAGVSALLLLATARPSLARTREAASPRNVAPVPSWREEPDSGDGLPRRLVLALDGIPYDLFAEAQRRGGFAEFSASRMVSTFPSLSDVAFSVIAGFDTPESYQVVYYDRELNRVVGNTLRSLSQASHGFLAFDSYNYNSGHRVLSYLGSYHSSLGELERIRSDFLHCDKQTFFGYVEASDAIMHVHGRKMCERFLGDVDRFLSDLSRSVRERTGRDLAIDLVSDHGSTLQRGRGTDIESALKQCGFRRSESLRDSTDVAYSLAGILNSVSISCAPEKARQVAECVLADPGTDLSLFVREGHVVVVSREGEAEVRLLPGEPERYSYRVLRGDPLRLGSILGIDPAAPRPVTASVAENELLSRTFSFDYPDPLRRIWRAFHGVVKQPADVLVSLRDGYEAGNAAVRLMAEVRGRAGTHGSLTRDASLGILVSNWRDLPDADAWMVRDLLFGDETLKALRAWPDSRENLNQTSRFKEPKAAPPPDAGE